MLLSYQKRENRGPKIEAMIEEDEEETVISKKSALYSYLLTSNEPDGSLKAEKDAVLEQVQKDQGESVVNSSRSSSFATFTRKLFSSFLPVWPFSKGKDDSGWFSRVVVPGKHEDGRRRGQTISLLLQSNLLDEDDEALLRAEQEIVASRNFRSRTKMPDIQSVDRPKLRKSHYLPYFGLIPYAIFRNYVNGGVFYLVDALVVALSLHFGFWVVNYRKSVQEWNTLAALLDKCKTMDTSLRKALRTIRDYEVLARGYTVVTKYTVLTNKSSPDSDVSPCPQIRKCVLLASEDLFTYFRSQTIEFSKRSGNTESGCDDLSLLAKTDELAGMFGDYSKKGDWQISLNALQTCCYCMTLQRSEFLRILAISKSGSRAIQPVLSKVIESVTKWEESIRRTLLYYNSHQAAEELSTATRLRALDSNTNPPGYDFVHSLGLHLRTALKRTIEFEEKLSSAKLEHPDAPADVYEAYKDELTSTLGKCHVCLDELQAFVNVSKGKEENEEQRSAWQLRSSEDVSAKNEKIIYDGTTPEIVDQVYEALTDDIEHQPSDFLPDGLLESENRLFISGRRHVLDELKSVLTVRSSLMHERELRALAARRGVTVEELLAEEESQRMEEKRKLDKESKAAVPDENTDDPLDPKSLMGGECRSLATELALAIQLKGFNRRNQETVLGDEDDESQED